ncbi:MAG: YbgA family protein, partial [bacterium]|nr:YbgA family protein [bacterium]
YISDKLNTKEKKHFLSLIENYGKKKIQIEVIIELLKSLSYRFENEYLLYQKYLEPYPKELNV